MPVLLVGGRAIQLLKSHVLIGYSSTNDVVVVGEGIEACHAVIEERDGSFWISSMNRLIVVKVNGENVRRKLLRDKDIITLGSQGIRFLLYYDMSQSSQAGIKERLEAYQRFYDFSQRVAEQLQSSELFEVIIEEIVSLTGADQGVVVSLSKGEQHLRAMVDHSGAQDLDDEASALSQSVITQVLQRKEPLLLNDLLSGQEFQQSSSIFELGLCSVMCAPLIMQGELLGVIYVGSHHPLRTFDSQDLESLCVFSAQAAMLLKSASIQDQLLEDNIRLRTELERAQFGSMIGASDAMQDVFEQVARVSRVSVNLLITGETGTGKELVAREVHRRSSRRDYPFISVNCGALPEGLIERELFGHKAGAFTDATSDKVGCFEAANGGTLFLDEIAELPLALQVKLLRAIEAGEVTPLGSNVPVFVDLRIISATNVNLSEAITEGRFRKDLYYRIQTIEVHLPPLRDRGRDVLLITRYLLSHFAKRYERPIRHLSSAAERAISRYSWPGNIRELENRLSQAVILSEGEELTPEDLNLAPELLTCSSSTLKEARDRFSHDYVRHVVALNDGNRSQAARDLDVDPRTVYRYLSSNRVVNKS